ncbi:hypothetical protein ALMP_12840 [Streptomyces sp. A012304]|nr:hypothetical protein ALMP_12840 [Streptomyces sp. A012304]
MRTAALPRPTASRRTVHRRPGTRSSSSLTAACVILLFLPFVFPTSPTPMVRGGGPTVRGMGSESGELALRACDALQTQTPTTVPRGGPVDLTRQQ